MPGLSAVPNWTGAPPHPRLRSELRRGSPKPGSRRLDACGGPRPRRSLAGALCAPPLCGTENKFSFAAA